MTEAEAIALLKKEAYTLLLYNETECITSRERGVAPLLALLDGGKECGALFAVDKVVGKAAAFLYIALGIGRLHAVTLSESALALLLSHSVSVTYEVLAPRILNRDASGFCPMESAVLSEMQVCAAIEKIRETRRLLKAKEKRMNAYFFATEDEGGK